MPKTTTTKVPSLDGKLNQVVQQSVPQKQSAITPEKAHPDDENEYDGDDFEKDDLVQMAEPKVARNPSIGSKK